MRRGLSKPARRTMLAVSFAGLLGCCELLWTLIRTGSTERGALELLGLLLSTFLIYGAVLGGPATLVRAFMPAVPSPALIVGTATAIWGGVYFHIGLRGGSPWLSLDGIVGSALALLVGALAGAALLRWSELRALGALAACGGLLLILTATAGERSTVLAESPARPRSGWTFLIVVDTLGARHSSLYGYERKTTPALDAFAANSVVFDHAIAPSSWTAPSMASVLTSLYPSTHQYRSFGLLPSDALTLPELFHAAGYVTAGWSSNIVVSTYSNFHQGFTYFDDEQARISIPELLQGLTLVKHVLRPLSRTLPTPPWGWLRLGDSRERRKAEHINRRFKEWFERRRLPGGFVYLHYMDPHRPYSPPPRFRSFGTDARARHDGDIAYWDAHFQDLLRFLQSQGVLEDSTIMVLGDHGEEFGEHGQTGHGHSLYEELVHVPLVLKTPAWSPRRIATTVSLVDVAPTLLELAGLSPQLPLTHGKSLSPLVRGDSPPELNDAFHFSEKLATTSSGSLEATYEDGWKLIWDPAAGRAELYELASDPLERVNRAREEAVVVQQLLGRHPRLSADTSYVARDSTDGESTGPSGELLRTLKALGYVQ